MIPETDAGRQAIFDQGHEVEEWAKQLFPDGIEVAEDASSLQGTSAAICVDSLVLRLLRLPLPRQLLRLGDLLGVEDSVVLEKTAQVRHDSLTT